MEDRRRRANAGYEMRREEVVGELCVERRKQRVVVAICWLYR